MNVCIFQKKKALLFLFFYPLFFLLQQPFTSALWSWGESIDQSTWPVYLTGDDDKKNCQVLVDLVTPKSLRNFRNQEHTFYPKDASSPTKKETYCILCVTKKKNKEYYISFKGLQKSILIRKDGISSYIMLFDKPGQGCTTPCLAIIDAEKGMRIRNNQVTLDYTFSIIDLYDHAKNNNDEETGYTQCVISKEAIQNIRKLTPTWSLTLLIRYCLYFPICAMLYLFYSFAKNLRWTPRSTHHSIPFPGLDRLSSEQIDALGVISYWIFLLVGIIRVERIIFERFDSFYNRI